MGRPGVMLYFDMLEPIRVLPDADKGRLLVAILEYGKEGTQPQFDGMLALAWWFVKPKIDRDREEYERTVLRRQYATFCRERKKKNEPEISFDEWLMITGYQMISHDINDDQWYPTTTTTTTTTPTTTPTTTTTPATTTTTTTAAAVTTNAYGDDATATAGNELKLLGGSLGKNVVMLTEMQTIDLIDKMGIDAFDYYADKLSSFILKNDAKVTNHYSTILSWWRKDSGLEGG